MNDVPARQENQLKYPKYKTHFSEFVGVGANGNLWVDGCDCQELADRFGTPLFVLSEGQFRHNYRHFRDAFRAAYPDVEVLFANKSANQLAVRHIFNQEGAGGDAFGLQEMYYSLLTGADTSKMVLNGSNKEDAELEMAVANKVCINIDAMDELERIDAAAKRLGATDVPLGIRVKLILDDLKDRYGQPMHGEGSLQEQAASHKWGMTMDETVELIGRIDKMPDMNLIELHYHLSRMDNKASDFAVMAREMIVWTDEIRKKTGWTAPTIDIGGGWTFGRAGGTGPERADDDKSAATFEDYGTEVCEAIKDECQKRNFPLPKLKMEPGRSISGSAGVAIGCVGAVKKHPAKTWINCDLSSNIITWVNFCHWYFPMYPVKDALAKATQVADLVGPLCSSDELGHARDFPELERGDYIALLDCGGYTESTMASFNAQLWPATVLVNGTQADVITERMRLSDVMGRFKVPPRLLDGSYGRLRESG